MKKLFATILILLLLAFPILGANTHTIDLEAGSSQDLQITDGDQTGLDLGVSGADFTMELWVNVETAPSNSRMALVDKHNGTSDSFYFVYMDTGGTKHFRIYMMNSASEIGWDDLNHDLGTATWHHVAAVYDASAGEVEIFVDSSSVGTMTGLVTNIKDSVAIFCIGSYLNGTINFFDGKIDDVRIWNDIRTDQEISDNYDCYIVGDEDNLVAYWKLDNSPNDETTNNNDLTEGNSPAYQSGDLPFTEECAVEEEVVPVQSEFWFK